MSHIQLEGSLARISQKHAEAMAAYQERATEMMKCVGAAAEKNAEAERTCEEKLKAIAKQNVEVMSFAFSFLAQIKEILR